MAPIPSERLCTWEPGVDVGVYGRSSRYRPGGADERTTLIDVTASPYSADNTGATDAHAAITAAIAAAAAGEVIYVPAGTFQLSTVLAITKSNITVRGAGSALTIIDYRGSFAGPMRLIAGGIQTAVDITAGTTAGSSTLTLSSATGFAVGSLVRISEAQPGDIPVVHVSFPSTPVRFQYVRVTAVSGNDITIDRPLLWTLGTTPQAARLASTITLSGFEGMTFDCRNSTGSADYGTYFEAVDQCWLHDIKILKAKNYPIRLYRAKNVEITKCYAKELKNTGPNGAGLLMEQSADCLIEDNLFEKQFPHIEVNFGSTGNAFLYNFCTGNVVESDLLGVSILANHGPHNSFNLYEGNVASKFQADGYFGSASDDTAYRNWFHASDPDTARFWIACLLNRFTRRYSIVGNMLGTSGNTYTVENPSGNGTYDTKYVYGLGFPNIGNLSSTGTADYSNADPWADFGTAAGPSGFQEWDLGVEATLIRKANWNAQDGAIPVSEELDEGETLPDSLAYSAQPDWWPTSLAWPPVDPTSPNEDYEMIPAGYRFLNGGEDPPDAPTTTTPNPLAFRSNAMLAMGAF